MINNKSKNKQHNIRNVKSNRNGQSLNPSTTVNEVEINQTLNTLSTQLLNPAHTSPRIWSTPIASNLCKRQLRYMARKVLWVQTLGNNHVGQVCFVKDHSSVTAPRSAQEILRSENEAVREHKSASVIRVGLSLRVYNVAFFRASRR